ncbi:hypothetical protein I2485_01940 [Nesterenkonia sp. E16_7]|uniref:hypothetical protein n=1 Tax=unclassified Nesterenkonia TaxID=2629769 RepID=UPI001A92033D|nr:MULTISPECIES: hypothetical protein [unclassified Nesterenkonia]MBO0596363.1 hypothetical protein [Nesterenkonia sp. E16_10]MBO0597409.1 hypothetical protein [Nesterenkonia sp. E16_7]
MTNATGAADTAQQLLDSINPQCEVGHPGPWQGTQPACPRPAEYSLRVHTCDTSEPTPAIWCGKHLFYTRSGWMQFLETNGAFRCGPCGETITSVNQVMFDVAPLR